MQTRMMLIRIANSLRDEAAVGIGLAGTRCRAGAASGVIEPGPPVHGRDRGDRRADPPRPERHPRRRNTG